jgi:hypothetical protein
MRIAHLLHHACQKEDKRFVRDLYRQLLNREPTEEEMEPHVTALKSGVSRTDLMIRFILSEEAKNVYFGQPPDDAPTVANKLKRIVSLEPERLVHELYVELLCRDPDPEGYEDHVNSLRQGAHPLDIVQSFMTSPEWSDLMRADRNSIARKILFHLLSKL